MLNFEGQRDHCLRQTSTQRHERGLDHRHHAKRDEEDEVDRREELD